MATNVTTFEIVKIRELSYNFKTLDDRDIQEFDKKRFNISFGLKIDKGDAEDIFVLTLKIVYEYSKDDGNATELLSMECEFRYLVGNLKEFIFVDGSNIRLPTAVMEPAVGTAISTIRGMIAVRTAGNFLANYPLPLVDITRILDSLKNISLHSTESKKVVKSARKAITPKKAKPKAGRNS